MTPDGLWQTKPDNISSWCWQSISDSSEVCAAVSIFIIWFVILSDSCYSNHCCDHSASHDPSFPLPKSSQDFSTISIILCQMRRLKTLVLFAPLLPLSLSSLVADCHLWLGNTHPYSTLSPPRNIFPAASKMFGHPIILWFAPDYSCWQGGEPAAPQLIIDYFIWAIPNPHV